VPPAAVVSAEIAANDAGGFRRLLSRVFLDANLLPQFFQKGVRAIGQVVDDAVVGENPHLVHRKQDRRKERELRGAGPFVLPKLGGGAAGGLAAVMPVGHVELRNGPEGVRERLGVGGAPDRVAHGAGEFRFGLEVVERLGLGRLFGEAFDLGVAPVGEHDRLGVGALGEDVARAVVFFGRARLFVLQDGAVVIFAHSHAAEEARLRTPVHHEAIDVEGRRVLGLHEARLGEAAQVFRALLIHLVSVLVGALRQVDLGANDVQEALVVALGEAARFFDAYHIVGHGGDGLGSVGARAQGAKRVQRGHACRLAGG